MPKDKGPKHSGALPWIAFVTAALALAGCIVVLSQQWPGQALQSNAGKTSDGLQSRLSDLEAKQEVLLGYIGEGYRTVDPDNARSLEERLAIASHINFLNQQYIFNLAGNPNNPAWPKDVIQREDGIMEFSVPPLPDFMGSSDGATLDFQYGRYAREGIQDFQVMNLGKSVGDKCTNETFGKNTFCAKEASWFDNESGQIVQKIYYSPRYSFIFMSNPVQGCAQRDSAACAKAIGTFDATIKRVLESVKVMPLGG